MVVIEGKQPEEREDVFIHLSCPVPSIMSRDWPLSTQQAAPVSVSWVEASGGCFPKHSTSTSQGTTMFLEEAEAESAHILR